MKKIEKRRKKYLDDVGGTAEVPCNPFVLFNFISFTEWLLVISLAIHDMELSYLVFYHVPLFQICHRTDPTTTWHQFGHS